MKLIFQLFMFISRLKDAMIPISTPATCLHYLHYQGNIQYLIILFFTHLLLILILICWKKFFFKIFLIHETFSHETNRNRWYIYIYRPIDIMVSVFAKGPGDQGSIPGWVIQMTQKMVPDAFLFNTQHYKIQINGKWSNLGEGVRHSLTPRCSNYWRGSLWVTLNYGQTTYLHIYMYIWNYIYNKQLESYIPICLINFLNLSIYLSTHMYVYICIYNYIYLYMYT